MSQSRPTKKERKGPNRNGKKDPRKKSQSVPIRCPGYRTGVTMKVQ